MGALQRPGPHGGARRGAAHRHLNIAAALRRALDKWPTTTDATRENGGMINQLPTEILLTDRRLTAAEFQGLADVPPEIERYANLGPATTKRAYKTAIGDFMRFNSVSRPEDFRIVTRAYVIAWRDDLVKRGLGGSTVRHRLSSLSSLFEYLCEKTL